MIQVRKATIKDMPDLLTLIKNINEEEIKYLRYDGSARQLLERLITNITNEHVLLFYRENELISYYEFTIEEDYVWIYSLYTKPKYRTGKNRTEHYVLLNMLRYLDKPIRFAVHPENRMMLSIVKKLGAQEYERDGKGFIKFHIGGF